MTPPKDLRALLREHIDRTGDSYSQIAAKTGLSKPLIGAVMTSTRPRSYRPDTIRRLADGLRLPVDVVTRAASVSAGMTVDEPTGAAEREDARVIVELLDRLSDQDLTALRVMVTALAERHGR